VVANVSTSVFAKVCGSSGREAKSASQRRFVAILSKRQTNGAYFKWTAPHLNQKLCYLRGSANVSGKALAASFTRHSPAASALPLTKVALSN